MLEIIPAVDLRQGRCVRLLQGDFARETVYGDDPIAMTRHWQEQGASRLHVVDLDGALAGEPMQLSVVARMVAAVQVPIQLGGGLRSFEHVQAALDIGVDRVVLGTAAIGGQCDREATAFRRACLATYGGRILIGLDARDGRLALQAWKETTQRDLFDFAGRVRREGFERVVYTDIKRDGALSGPNVQDVERLARIPGLAVLASGGISSLDDLVALSRAGAEAAIVGRALYTGALRLLDAVHQLSQAATRT
jgi:phosphoribosylformimino-5-aminoimidazole carboxamide ribotide isomerase